MVEKTEEMGIPLIKKVLVEKCNKLRYSYLVKYLKEKTGKSERTVKNWLEQCKKYGTRYGIVYEKHQRETYLYAKECQEIIHKNEEKFKHEIEMKIEKKQKSISEKKNEMGDAFEYWLRYMIKNILYHRITKSSLHKSLSRNNHYFGKYYFGESAIIAEAKRITEGISKDLKEKTFEKKMINGKEFDEKKFLENEYDYYMDYLEMEDDIIFMDAILSHPEEIQEIAWKWFIYYEEKIDAQMGSSSAMGGANFFLL